MCQAQVAPAPNLLPALLRVSDAAEVTLRRDAVQLIDHLHGQLLDEITALEERALTGESQNPNAMAHAQRHAKLSRSPRQHLNIW